MSSQSLISVGIPVYNSEKTISRCLESILGQTHLNVEIIISDNNSTDRTFEICKSYAKKDARVVVYKQESNIGPARNFAFVLEKSSGEFFCWVGSDDVRSSDFLQLNYTFLENNLGAVASTSPHEFLNYSSQPIVGKAFSLCGEFNVRVTKFLSDPWNSHALFYSLYRRKYLDNYPKLGQNFFGWDWAIIFYVSIFGNMHRVNQGLISLQSGGQSDRPDALKMSGVKGMKYLYPLSNFASLVLVATFKTQPLLLFSELRLLTFLHFQIMKYEYQLMKHKFKMQVKMFAPLDE